MATQNAETHYAARRDSSRALAARLSTTSASISLARVLVALLGIALAIAAFLPRFQSVRLSLGISAGLVFVVFIALAVVHDSVLKRKVRAERSVEWAEEGIARLEDRFTRKPKPSDPKPNEEHPYEDDLDVFGEGSLMQSLDTTRTMEGKDLLASWLRKGASADEVELRQRCGKDLATRLEFLEDLSVEGALLAREPTDPTPLLRWAESKSTFSNTNVVQAIALAFPVVTLGLLFFGGLLPIPRAIWVVSLVAQILFGMRHRAAVTDAVEAASSRSDTLARYARMFGVIERATFEEPHLVSLRGDLEGASIEAHKLGRIVGFVDARQNEVFRLIIGPLLLWDLNCALALDRWRRRAGTRVRAHIAAMARVESLGALATRAFERPKDAWPRVVPLRGGSALSTNAEPAHFRAKQLGHPLLASKKVVRNDVTLEGPGSVLLVTGSNMSGKSTLLRAMGTNVVLALAGAPVRADELVTSPFDVHTSMRVRDSLSSGVSHFLAELKRLKSVVDAADAADGKETPVLFLLDEILHGTNSRERHLGARAIVRHLSQKNACGAVSTHDLALSALADEVKGLVKNVHFREQVGPGEDGTETMTFDYRLREGVVTSSNALRLMRMVGIDIAVEPEERS